MPVPEIPPQPPGAPPGAAAPGGGVRPRAVLATDFDRTLTGDDLRPDAKALAAVARLRTAGHPCILVTGRPQRDLAEHPGLATSFDGFVLEGGALWGPWDALRVAPNAAFVQSCADKLEKAGIAIERRQASFSASTADEAEVLRIAGSCSIHRNVDRFDVLPPGHDKGTGLASALALLELGGRPVVAVGDGDNDVPLLRAADVGLALANAGPALRAIAHDVTKLPGPAGFVEVAGRLLESDLPLQGLKQAVPHLPAPPRPPSTPSP